MNVTIKRTDISEQGAFSEVYDDLARQIAVGLERAFHATKTVAREIVDIWAPKIPEGAYECVRGKHRLDGMLEDFETFEITGVDGHTGLLFHWGNWTKDSDGCVLLGTTRSKDMIMESRQAFNRFMALQAGVDKFTLQVTS